MESNKDKELRVLMGMDAYLPDVDGVIQCMHNYCTNLNGKCELLAMAPKHKKSDDSKCGYKILRCKSIYIPFVRNFYCVPNWDRKFKKLIKEKEFDIVHVHSPFNMAKFALKTAKKKGIPCVATFHTNFRPIFRKVFGLKCVAEMVVKHIGRRYNKFDKIFVCSEKVAEQARSFGYKGEIVYLPYGTELNKAIQQEIHSNIRKANEVFKLKEDELVFLFVGRIMKLKRIEFTLDALKIVKNNDIKFKFYIVGKGADLESTQKYAQKLGFTDDEVIFTGFLEREKFPLINSRANLLLFPSLYDNFGLVKVEASAYDTAGVFVKDSCAGCEIVDGENGFLCENNVQNYAETIMRAVSDRKKLEDVGKNAGQTLYINWATCTDILLKTYNEIIKEYKTKNTNTTSKKKHKQKKIRNY